MQNIKSFANICLKKYYINRNAIVLIFMSPAISRRKYLKIKIKTNLYNLNAETILV